MFESKSVRLVPTQGCYQKEIIAEIVRETEKFIFVKSDYFMG